MPIVKYHRLCYQTFTMNSKLERIQNQNLKSQLVLERKIESVAEFESGAEENEDDGANRPKRKPQKEDSNILLPKECIFCNRRNYKNKRLEPLTIETIKKAATAADDFSMLGLFSQDLIAAEAKYQVTCYKLYTKVKLFDTAKNEPNKSIYERIELEAFKEVVINCHDLSIRYSVVPFTLLQKKMEEIFIKNEIQMTVSTKKHLRRNMEKHVTDISFINVEGSLYVYSKSLTVDMLAKHLIKLQK